jgi:hypothetical protein
MEDLIRQAFLHVDVIGQHVAEGHYDLVGPNGDIILPQVWETVVEPDWTITMHMWPIPEKPKSPDPPVILDDDSALVTVVDTKKSAEIAGAPIPPPPPPPPLPPPDVGVSPVEVLPLPDVLVDGPPIPGDVLAVSHPSQGPKKPRPREPNPGSLALWMAGNRGKQAKSLKVEKKPEVVQQHDDSCCVM